MKTSLECMECNVKQVIKVAELLKVSELEKDKAMKRVKRFLKGISYENSNPYVMGETWKIIIDEFHNPDPYKTIKIEFNQMLLDVYNQVDDLIIASDDQFDAALKIAVTGNLIDFGAKHKFSKQEVLDRINNYYNIEFKRDDSKRLKSSVLKAKQILYIGDNCGEIVLDKLFIKTIKELNPEVKVYFGVRGGPILNDVTLDDAIAVGMSEVSEVVSSGSAIPGTIIESSTTQFQKLFFESDVVIAKGQGNFESLSDIKRENLYLMLMSKCDFVSRTIGVNTMDYVLIENK